MSSYNERTPLISIVLQQSKRSIVERNALMVNTSVGAAYVNGVDLELSKRELAILIVLAQSEGHPVAASILYEKAWGRSMNNDTQALRQAISRLRRKLSGSGCTIDTIRNKGYRLKPEESPNNAG